MSTVIKQWLQQKIADMEATRDEIPFGLDEDDSNTLAAMRIALASLEAEPVCVIDQSNLDYLRSGADADVWPASRTEMGDVLLYRTAPPAPVSMKDHQIRELVNELRDIAVEYHGTQQLRERIARTIRAAMLQGAENAESPTTMKTAPALDSSPKIAESTSGNSPVIPGGQALVPVEPTLEMIKAGANAASSGMLIPGMYRAMLAAAPQQEVK